MQETQVQSLGWEDPLEKGTATNSSIPVFWPGEVHGLCSPWGRKELATFTSLMPYLMIYVLVGNVIIIETLFTLFTNASLAHVTSV